MVEVKGPGPQQRTSCLLQGRAEAVVSEKKEAEGQPGSWRSPALLLEHSSGEPS